MNELKARALVNSMLIAQKQQPKAFKQLVVNHKDLRNELLDAFDCLNYNYNMMPAKIRDKSFQKAGEENYKTIWVFTLIDQSLIDPRDMM